MVREFTSADGLQIKVGENAAENDEICKHARQNDEWFHVDGASSAHVVLSVEKQPAPRDSIRECAVLAKHFSKQRYTLNTFHSTLFTQHKLGHIVPLSLTCFFLL